MSISVKLGTGDSDAVSGKKNKALHKKPWFWLLLLLIASIAVKISSRSQSKSFFLNSNSDDDDVSSTFSFQPDMKESFSEDNFSEDKKEDNEIINESVLPDDDFDENDVEITEVTAEDSPSYEQEEPEKSVFHFIINLATKKYHTKECSAVKKLAPDKRMDTDIEADSLNEAESIMKKQGFELCGLCDR